MEITSLYRNQLHKEHSMGLNYTNTHLILITLDHIGNTKNDALGKFHESTCSMVDIVTKSSIEKD